MIDRLSWRLGVRTFLRYPSKGRGLNLFLGHCKIYRFPITVAPLPVGVVSREIPLFRRFVKPEINKIEKDFRDYR